MERSFIKDNRYTIVTACILLIGYSLPNGPIENFRAGNSLLEILFSSNLLHLYSFGFFAFVLGWERSRVFKFTGRQWIVVGIIALAYGLFIEIYQLLLPYRGTQVSDVIWDIIGIALGLGVAYGVLAWRKH